MKLGDVATYVNGYAFKPSDYSDSGLPIVRIQNLTGNAYRTNRYEGTLPEKFAIQDGDILISWSASLGVFEWNQGSAWLNQHIFRVVFNKAMIDKRFFVHQARFLIQKSQNLAHGATMKHLTKKVFEMLPFLYLGLNNQKMIAEQLDALDTQINRAKRQIRFLDNLVKSRFVEMFGDPVLNPKGWSTHNLKALGELKNGVNFKSVDNGFEIKCLGVGDFKDRYAIKDMSLVSDVSLNDEPNANQLLQDGDVVFVRSNGNKALVGRCLAIFPGEEKVTFSGFCIRFRNASKKLELDYLLNCLKTDSIRRAMTGRGANIQNLSQSLLSKIEIPLPPIALQREFAAFVSQVDKSRFS